MPKEPKTLSRKELIRIVDDIQACLWLDINKYGDIWNPTKEWDPEIIEFVADTLIHFGLRPNRKERA